MMVKRSVFVAAFVVALAIRPALVAQEAPPPPPTPPVAVDDSADKPKRKAPFGLYIGAGYGSASADDFDLSNQTLSSHTTTTTFSMDEHSYAQAAIGWHLGNNNGDFRLVFNGYSEDSFEVTSTGFAGVIQVAPGSSQPQFNDNLPWWNLTISDGRLLSVRTPMIWEVDTNGNGFVDLGEETALPADLTIDRPFTDNLQNRAQHWDALYGNSWGPRTFRGRWWAGLRYFQYEGNIIGTGWLATTSPGYGFTDGSFLHELRPEDDRRRANGVARNAVPVLPRATRAVRDGASSVRGAEPGHRYWTVLHDRAGRQWRGHPGGGPTERERQQEHVAEHARGRRPLSVQPQGSQGHRARARVQRDRIPRLRAVAHVAANPDQQPGGAVRHVGDLPYAGSRVRRLARRDLVPILRPDPLGQLRSRSSWLQNDGFDLPTQSASSIVIPSTRRPATANAIAIR